MGKFRKLFGIEEDAVKKTCIFLPLATKEILDSLNVKKMVRGKIYGSGQGRDFTVIHTGMGPTWTGDAVLYLVQTACENIILFGACGSTGMLSVGTLVMATLCYEQETFSKLLGLAHETWPTFYPDRQLMETLDKKRKLKRAACLTVTSLKLQQERLMDFKKRAIDVVDMECSAFFAASRFIKRRAAALLFITDIIGQKPFYEPLNSADKKSLSLAIKEGTRLICDFINLKQE